MSLTQEISISCSYSKIVLLNQSLHVVLLAEVSEMFTLCLNRDVSYNLLFLLSGAGKFNFQGTKRWIEDQLEATGLL